MVGKKEGGKTGADYLITDDMIFKAKLCAYAKRHKTGISTL